MNYVLANSPCFELNSKFSLQEKIWYLIEEGESCLFLFAGGHLQQLDFNALTESEYCHKFCYKQDNYFLLTCPERTGCAISNINYKNKKVDIALLDNLCVTIDGKCVLDRAVKNIKYDSFAIIKDFLVINFVGEPRFVVIIKDDKLMVADYYHQAEIKEDEAFFLTKLFDCINHGRVNCISAGKFDSYLVYLDDDEMCLLPEFCALTWMDLVKAGNLKYANNLFCDELKQEDSNKLKVFLPEFDDFVPISNLEICLLKNDKPVGIAVFELLGDKIANITLL